MKRTHGENTERLPNQDTLLLIHLFRTSRAMVSGFERYVNMPMIRHWLLGQFRECEELSQAELQQRLGVDSATITRQVKSLESSGLLIRRPDPKDNRYTLVSLTEKGRETVSDLQMKRATYEASLLAGLSEDQVTVFEQCLNCIEVQADNIALGTQPGSGQETLNPQEE